MTDLTEQKAPTAGNSTPSTPPSMPPKAPAKKKKKKKIFKKIIVSVLLLAIIGVGGYFLYDKIIKEQPNTMGEIMTSFVQRGSIQSTVQGSGLTRAKDSANVTPTAGGSILELYVSEGEQITEGQQLYRMDDADAQKTMNDAQKVVTNTNKELQALYDSVKELTITAPHAGKMMKVSNLRLGDDVAKGTVIATIVDDTKLKLHLYFSYAYESDIQIGQEAEISIPATMSTVNGQVETINKVEYIVPEGSVLFEAVIVLENPGTLTEGMEATASLVDEAGNSIFPYKAGLFEYYQTTEVKAKVAGPVEQVSLLNYSAVTTGQLLVQLGAKDNDEEVATKENALKTAQDKLTEAQNALTGYNAVAPISGTILSCNLVEGSKVESGQGITIADTSTMIVEVQVDERNIRYVKPGMMVNLDQYGTPFMGIVDSVSLTGKAENGVSAYPCIVKVDNPDGALMTNMYLQYSFVASQSDDCLLVPAQAVQYVSLPNQDGDAGRMDGADGMGEIGIVDGAVVNEGEPMPEGDDIIDEAVADTTMTDDTSTNSSTSDAAVSDVIVPRAARAMSSSRTMGGGGGGGMSSASGDMATVVFIKGADDGATPPANAITPDPTWQIPEKYFPVVVEVGLSDTTNAEIKSGLNEGDEVFIGYATQNAWG